MSNATETPKKQGQRRRRRRGGRNRNQQNNNNQNSHNPNKRSQGGNKDGERPRRRRARRKPIQLSWWDKVLIAIGFKEDPNQKRKGNQGSKSPSKKSGKKPKSNVRNARSTQEARSKEETGGPKSDTTSQRAKRSKQRKGGNPASVKSNRIYVGNLSYDVTEQDLKELFKGVGTVRAVEIVYNHNTHRSKGYGFVDMMNKDDAMRSVEVLHDQPFMGRNMTVSGAKTKGDEEDNEPAMEIKATDVELAPLPEKNSAGEAAAAAAGLEPEAAAQASDEATPVVSPSTDEASSDPEAKRN